MENFVEMKQNNFEIFTSGNRKMCCYGDLIIHQFLCILNIGTQYPNSGCVVELIDNHQYLEVVMFPFYGHLANGLQVH